MTNSTNTILINHVEADEPVFMVGARYKVFKPTKKQEPQYFRTYQDALLYVETLTTKEAQLTLF